MKTFLSVLFSFFFFIVATQAQFYAEDFEGFPAGTLISEVSPFWGSFDDPSNSSARIISGNGASGNQSLFPNFMENVILRLGNIQTGQYTFSCKIFVKTDTVVWTPATIIFQHGENAEIGSAIFFDADGEGKFGNGFVDFPFSYDLDEWVKVDVSIDLEADEAHLYLNGNELAAFIWSETALGGGLPPRIGGVRFYYTGDSTAYGMLVDDVFFVNGLYGPYSVSGIVKKDGNSDCQSDANEVGLSGFKATINNGAYNYHRWSDGSGEFISNLWQEGTSTITIEAPGPYWEICSYNPTFEISGIDEVELEFSAQAIIDCPAMTADITAPLLRRCFPNNISISYCNEGTVTAEDAQAKVVLDGFMNFLSASLPVASQDADTLWFELGDIAIDDCGEIIVEVEISCDAVLGAIHCYSVQVFPDTICTGSARNLSVVEECRPNIGAYDPNDKTGFPLGEAENHRVEPGTELKYQVRFQNTGTDTAFNIVVVDTLPESLDVNSIRFGAVSHQPVEMIVDEGRILKAIFQNIMLPDSNVNEAASHGFFNFFILPKADLALGTAVENSAAIYFDFNEPVITNTTLHTFDFETAVRERPGQLHIVTSPNPAAPQQSVFVSVPDENFAGDWQLFSPDGKMLQFGSAFGKQWAVPAPMLPGVYFLRLTDSATGNVGTQKLVVH